MSFRVRFFISIVRCRTQEFINGHFRNLNWRYLPYIRPIFRPKFQGIYPKYGQQYGAFTYLHFRILSHSHWIHRISLFIIEPNSHNRFFFLDVPCWLSARSFIAGERLAPLLMSPKTRAADGVRNFSATWITSWFIMVYSYMIYINEYMIITLW